MGKAVEYKFIPEGSIDSTQTCPIEITSGQFAGIIYRYGKISFKETIPTYRFYLNSTGRILTDFFTIP